MKSRGFTLIELLVVIAMLGILITGVLMGMNTAKRKAFDTKARSCAHQIRTQQERIRTTEQRFKAFSDLGPVAACETITPVGNATNDHYAYRIKHPKGQKTFTITDSDLYTDGIGSAGKVLADDAMPAENSGGAIPLEQLTPYRGSDVGYFVYEESITGIISMFYGKEKSRSHLQVVATIKGPDGKVVEIRPMNSLQAVKAGNYELRIANKGGCTTYNVKVCGGVLTENFTVRPASVTGVAGSADFFVNIGEPPRKTYAYQTSITSADLGLSYAQRNIARIEAYDIYHPTEPEAPCVGDCDLAPGSPWLSRRIADIPATFSGTPEMNLVGTAIRLRYTPADPSQPMNLSGLPSMVPAPARQNVYLVREYDLMTPGGGARFIGIKPRYSPINPCQSYTASICTVSW